MARKNPMAIDSIPKELAPYIDQSDYSNWLQNKSARAILTPPTSETPLLPATTVDRDITQPTPIVSTPTLELPVIAHETPLSPALPSQPIAEVNQRSATEKFNFEAFANEIGSRTLAAELLGIPIPGESTTTKERKQKDSEKDRQYISKVKTVGGMALAAVTLFSAAYLASTAGQAKWNSLTNRAPAVTAEPFAPTTEPKIAQQIETTTSTTPEIPMAAEPLNIQPKAEFLVNGELVAEDYAMYIEATGNHILGFEVPSDAGEKVANGVNATVINTLTEAKIPQILTQRVKDYATEHPDFVPTALRNRVEGKTPSYLVGKTSGSYQKTAMHEYRETVLPGRVGNSFFKMHASTWNAGGGDMPALRAGDLLELERKVDGNKYTFKYVGEPEIINVNKDGSLTQDEVARQMAKGFGPNVTFDDVAHTFKGYESVPTITIQICGNRDGTPGGVDGVGSADARILFRFVLEDQQLKIRYPAS